MRYKGQNNQGGAKTGASYIHMSTYAFSCVLLYENTLFKCLVKVSDGHFFFVRSMVLRRWRGGP